MQIIKPDYYDKFKCIADRCPDTCCAGWQIMIDEESLERYETETGSFKDRLHASIDWEEGCFKNRRGRCIFLNDSNLCDLYTALGEDALCYTCTMYPRHVEEFEGVREYSLSLSCPEAARIMWEHKGPVSYVCEEDDREEEEEFEDYDPFLYEELCEIREAFFEVLNHRELSTAKREELILRAAKDIQYAMDEENTEGVWDAVDVLREAAAVSKTAEDMNGESGEPAPDKKKWIDDRIGELDLLKDLELINEAWEEKILTAERALKAMDPSDDRMDAMVGTCENTGSGEETFREMILHFFIFTYFCGAVYDGYVYARAALAILSVRWIYILAKLGDFPEIVPAAVLYAREVEHSDENVSKMLEWLDANS